MARNETGSQNSAQAPHPTQIPILELAHKNAGTLKKLDDAISDIDLARTAAQIWAGSNAFRRYSVLANLPTLNSAGNFRGMVISAKWRSVFNFTSELGEYTENLGALSAFVAGLAEAAPQVGQTLQSKDPDMIKTAKIASIAGTVAQRTLAGVIPAGVHLIYQSLEGWCMILGLAGGRTSVAANSAISVLQNADALVRTTFNTITDTQNQANTILHPVASTKTAWSVIQIAVSGG